MIYNTQYTFYVKNKILKTKERFAYCYLTILRFDCIDSTIHTLYSCVF